jgi:hypothetical protein
MIVKVIPSLKTCFKEQEYKWDKEDEENKKSGISVFRQFIFILINLLDYV